MSAVQQTDPSTSYPVTDRNKVKRLHERGSYDRAAVHAILDAAMLCHVAYAIDGQPYCMGHTRLAYRPASRQRVARG